MNYLKIYVSLIEKAKYTNIKKQNGIAYDVHHIIPKCCNGSNDDNNLVVLTCREHFIAHKLLPYIYKNTKYEYSLICAIWRMSHTKRYKKVLTSRSYQIIRNKRLNTPIPKHVREKMRNSKLGHKQSLESKIKVSQKIKNRHAYNDGIRTFYIYDNEAQELKLIRGSIKKHPPEGMIWIHNNNESILIKITDKLPLGYQYGYVPAHKLYKPIYQFVTNGICNSLIKVSDPIPNGYKIGRTKNVSTQKRLNRLSNEYRNLRKTISSGRIWVNDGKQNFFVHPNEIPSNCKLGRIKGKIWVNNGVKAILANPQQIPEGFQKGLGRSPWNKKIKNG